MPSPTALRHLALPNVTARIDSGLTQHELAIRLGVSRQFVGQIERGARPIPAAVRAQLDEIFKDPDPSTAPRGAYRRPAETANRLGFTPSASSRGGLKTSSMRVACRHGCGREMSPGAEATHARHYCPRRFET